MNERLDGQSNQGISFWLVVACFLLSGFAALVYETVWLRQFAILLGTSEQALAIVLSSYMGGLSIGAVLASRFVDRVRRPLLVYGILELGIAVTALAIPIGLHFVEQAQRYFFGGLAEPPEAGGWAQGIFTFVSVATMIVIPTALMGATLPLLARYTVRSDAEVGTKIGLLYAINTFGAVLGTLAAAFLCLPLLGLSRTTWIAAATNVFVFLLVVYLVRLNGSSSIDPEQSSEQAQPIKPRKKQRKSGPAIRPSGPKMETKRYYWALPLIAASGAVSFCFEIVLTRMLGHFLGGSVYSFATMLAGFLLGIAIGGGVAAKFAASRENAVRGFIIAQALIAAFALFALTAMNGVVTWFDPREQSALWRTIAISTFVLTMLPMSTAIGATFPFAIRIFAKDRTDAASGTALVYGWNVVGGIIGALMTGVVLLPQFEYHGTLALAAVVNLILAIIAISVFRMDRRYFLAPAMAVVAFAIFFPRTPENILRSSPLRSGSVKGEMLYNHVGKSATVSVFYDQGEIKFITNGLPESRLMPRDSGLESRSTGAWLTGLPPLLNPKCDSMLVIGLGGGSAVEQVAPSVKSIDVIELEPAVIEANRRVSTLRTRDPFEDPRIRLIINDGRNALSRTSKKYDAIVSQPSHPWTAGASHLYTREFADQVSARLNENGIFLQWMASDFVDPTLVASMAATLRDVYPHVRLYEPFLGTLLFVASNQPVTPENATSADATSAEGIDANLCVVAPEDREYYRRFGVITKTHLFALLSVDEIGLQELSANADLISDEQNLLAMRAPSLLHSPKTSETGKFIASFSPLNRGREAIDSLCPTFDPIAYAKQSKTHGHAENRIELLGKCLHEPSDQAVIRWWMETGEMREKVQSLEKLTGQFPNDSRLAFQYLRLCALGLGEPLSKAKTSELKKVLSPTAGMVFGCIEAIVNNDWAAIKAQDDALAKVSVSSLEHEAAVMSRLPWRMETAISERMQRGGECLEIISRNGAYIDPAPLAWFRVEAAMMAGNPIAALGSANSLAREVEEAMSRSESKTNIGNLIRIRRSLDNQAAFSSLPAWYYREVVQYVDRVLSNATYQSF